MLQTPALGVPRDTEVKSPEGAGASISGRCCSREDITYRQYCGEQDIHYVMDLVDNELSEPYSIFTYRYFLHSWPRLCWLAFHGDRCFGVIVCKADNHKGTSTLRGYVAMLVVMTAYRGLGVGTELVKRAIEEMAAAKAEEVVLEAEVTNKGALALYRNLGFLRDKRLLRYYLNGADAFRLKLLLPLPEEKASALAAQQLAGMHIAQSGHAQPCQ
ncbi:N-alpha-acetyltransferase mak3 [Coccomyxa viridis]|uniref:N-alpha-acetyltransferase mak3 n=1 Tax=Coccomyxa viridis TaxID=1274662 RepID=A0AAV1IFP7_9CHLO|nr:N-alpha-acetyltransferase mak3 [Coccomyxa viridis]